MSDERLGEIMTRSVLSATVDMPLQDVAAKMSESRVSCAVVCAENGEPLGVISERDLTRAYARDIAVDDFPRADSVMSQGVWALTEEQTCSDAMQAMSERGIRRLVIVDKSNKLVGIATQTDILRAQARSVEQQKRLLEFRVAERTRELSEVNARLEALASIDPLMGIGNRRAMGEELERLAQRVTRYYRPYSVALVDVDFFKKFNDHYGHRVGDDALKIVAATIVSTIRKADDVFRYGGEELLMVFPEVGESGARTAAQHVCDAIAALKFPHELSSFGHLTISIGVAEEDMANPDWAHTVARADEALYVAKHAGRNRVAAVGDKNDAEVAA
ncbi:MAG: diguanylate cyclase (GGDEF)-like protein [Gammaproteobacteria bacterium]|jgi:diguanylate cyclase (GGDEF)-like protein